MNTTIPNFYRYDGNKKEKKSNKNLNHRIWDEKADEN